MVSEGSGELASATRSVVLTRGGMVCSASPLAASAGVQALHEGGNAFDAAIATAAAECVTLPPMCGVGGEVFALLYEAATGVLWGVTGSGRAPAGATREFFAGRGYATMPLEGPLSASIPGETHAWQTILERFGTLGLERLLTPAVGLAAEGFPLPERIAAYYPMNYEKLRQFPASNAIFHPAGRPLRAGELLVQRDLGRTLRRIAQGGAQELYQGALGQELVRATQQAGGLFSAQDLAQHTTELYPESPHVTYRGHTVYANAPPSQAFLILELLNLVERFDLAAMGHNSADAIHVLVEAKKLAFADRLAYAGDPAFVDMPLAELLSKPYAQERSRAIDMARAAPEVMPGALGAVLAPGGEHTSYFCVVDAAGNAASFIHSLSAYYGSGFVAGDTGVLLNNRAGRGFFLTEGHPNVIAPGKRTMNTIQTYMVFRDGVPVIVGGTPGGDSQPQWNAQLIANLLDYGMNVQEAAEAPRWRHSPGTDPAAIDGPSEIRAERGIPEHALTELRRRGHRVVPPPAGDIPGAAQLIRLGPDTGIRMGGTDPRCDGYPMPQ